MREQRSGKRGKFQNGKEFCYRDSRNSTTRGDKQKWDREKNSRVKWDFYEAGRVNLEECGKVNHYGI